MWLAWHLEGACLMQGKIDSKYVMTIINNPSSCTPYLQQLKNGVLHECAALALHIILVVALYLQCQPGDTMIRSEYDFASRFIMICMAHHASTPGSRH